MARRIMRELKINEISSVTNPAQKGARVVIMKSDDSDDHDDAEFEKLCKRTFTAEERRASMAAGHAMPGGRYPIENVSDLSNAMQAIGRGKGSHAAIRAHIVSRAKSLGATDSLPEEWRATKRDLSRIRNALREANFDFEPKELSKFAERLADDALLYDPADVSLFEDVEGLEKADELDTNYAALCVSVESIFADADAVNKSDLLQATFQQFKDAIQGVVSEGVETTIVRALAEGDNGGSMSKAIAKSLGLAETATEAEITAEIEKRAIALKAAEDMAAMSAKHKRFMESDKAKMPKGGKAAFTGMSPSERDAHMSANPMDAEDAADSGKDESTEKMIEKGDAFKSVAGKVYLKSKVGAEVFDALKDQDAQIRKANDRAEKLDAEARVAKFAKAAEGFAKVGKPDELGALLAKTAAHEPALADAWTVVLSTAEERIAKGTLFTEVGSGAKGFGKALDGIDAKAKELLTKGEKAFNTIEKCRMEIRKRFPDLAQQEQDELAATKKAA